MDIIALLNSKGQSALASRIATLKPASIAKLERQIKELDWDELKSLTEQYVFKKPETSMPGDLSPAPYLPLKPNGSAQESLYADAMEEGVRLISSGRVAVLTVAGGQGTRLGFDGPKGSYLISPVKRKSLFQYFAESIARVSEKFSSPIHWFIMTSELNDAATKSFFDDNSFFGLDRGCVHFFTQGAMPSIAYDGSLILSAPDSLAMAPNGHGGTLLALKRSGSLDMMRSAGVELLSYFQVDNPLVPVVNPLFIGLHKLQESEMSAIMLPKTGPMEKLGNFSMSGGKLHIIEYSDLPESLASRRRPDGSLEFIAGSPAIHVISRDFIERLTKDGRLDMPWHRADKAVPFVDESGSTIKPDKPNAVKLESFIFDALQLAGRTMILEGCREEIFGPTKNATGVDSAESCRAMLVARDARRLELAGLKVPRKPDGSPDCVVEISPRMVFDDEDAIRFLKSSNASAPSPGSQAYYGDDVPPPS